MIGKVIMFAAVGGSTLGIYTAISSPTMLKIGPPLQPVPATTYMPPPVTPTRPPIYCTECTPGDLVKPSTTTPPAQPPPFDYNGAFCAGMHPTPVGCPAIPPSPTPWPGQHYGEQIV